MKLVVGLGNPGRKYAGTRHNVGFMVLAELARRHGPGRSRSEFEGEAVDAVIEGQRVLLLCPHTFMNLSGRSVRKAMDFYKIDVADLLVVCDDINLPVGRLRLRAKGSSGGQKGLKDIEQHLGTQEYSRLRLGIGQPPARWDAADYVLARPSGDEATEINLAVARAADAAASWVGEGIEACMNRYNYREPG